MRNPLFKRLPRELKHDIGKYPALFLFLTLTIGFVSGFIVAGKSMKSAYDNSFDKYNIEHGHFILAQEADEQLISDIEDEFKIDIYELFRKNKEAADGDSVRFFRMRKDINKADTMKGRLPENDGEIAVDRLYAEKNNIKVGDIFTAAGKNFKVTGFAALSDYSALFKNNTDMLFDTNKFTVALVTDNDFDSLGDAGLEYCYAWRDRDNSMDYTAQKEKADDIAKFIAERAVITDYVPRPDNQAINFTGDDLGHDKIFAIALLYIVIVVLAFAFAVTTKSTIEQEAPVIGTLRASGYTKGEILFHYITLPVAVTLIAAAIGNILGYTFMKKIVVSMYYNSYSLPTYKTLWSSEAFWKTTFVPVMIIFIVNLLIISSSLSISPLQFLRRDLSKRRRKKAVKLPDWKFFTRFRTRVILQNMSAYVTLFVGIFFSCVLLLFGLMFTPLLNHFKDDVLNSKISEYQYILKAPVPTENEKAEKYCAASLDNKADEEITIYGIENDSDYVKNIDLKDGKVYISDGFAEKYSIEDGDEITLHDKYTKEKYTFTVGGTYDYPASLCLFMSKEKYAETFDVDEDCFTGYFSNEKLDDIDDNYIAGIITEHDLTIMADQLDDSMGMIFPLFGGFGIIIFALMIYLLAKLIIEKNSSSISMVKILGYTDGEASKLYNRATAVVVVISLLISMPLCMLSIKGIYYTMMMDYAGWLTYYIAPWIYPVMFAMGIACFGLVSIILLRKIKRIPLSQALKNME